MEVTWDHDLLGTIDPLDPNERGVYVIWIPVGGNFRCRALYVGQGDPIRRRLQDHNDDPKILAHGRVDELVVSRAVVNPQLFRDGIERFLADVCQPRISERHPHVEPVPVNLPFPQDKIEGLNVFTGLPLYYDTKLGV